MASQQKFIGITDGDFKQAIFEARSDAEKGRDVGALILSRLKRNGVWKGIKSPTARQLLYSFCFQHGQIEDFSAGLIVRKDAKAIAAEEGLGDDRSAYAPLRCLEQAEVIERFSCGGNRPDAYEVVMPPPAPEEKSENEAAVEVANVSAARARIATTAQLARARIAEANVSATCDTPNPLTDHELARARIAEANVSATYEIANAGFSTGNPLVANVARALPPHDGNDDDEHHTWGQKPKTAEEEERVYMILLKCGIDPGPARKFSRSTSRLDAMALEIMLKPKRRYLQNPGGWSSNQLKEGTISDEARTIAARQLTAQSKPPTPPPNPQAEIRDRDEAEAQLDRTIAAFSDEQLAEMAQAVLDKYQGNAAVTNVLKRKPPRECRLMKMEIVGILKSSAAACAPCA